LRKVSIKEVKQAFKSLPQRFKKDLRKVSIKEVKQAFKSLPQRFKKGLRKVSIKEVKQAFKSLPQLFKKGLRKVSVKEVKQAFKSLPQLFKKGLRKVSIKEVKQAFESSPQLFKLIIVFALVNVLLVAGISSVQQVAFQSTGLVKSINVGVYLDANCTIQVGGIDWGLMEPGENITREVYLRNEGNVEVVLSIWAANWSSPEVEEFMDFSSDYQDSPVGVANKIPLKLILHLSPDIKEIETFGFDIIIETRG